MRQIKTLWALAGQMFGSLQRCHQSHQRILFISRLLPSCRRRGAGDASLSPGS